MKSFLTILRRLPRAVVLMYLSLFLIQRWLIFPAYMAHLVQGELHPPSAYGLKDFSEIQLVTSDNVHVMGWFHPAASDHAIILYFHGNAMHLGARAQRFATFAKEGYGVFALSYRGYGKSEGFPSENGLYNDARAAIAWIHQHIKNPKIILYGESLGTGVATEMSKEYNTYGLVLQSAYTSIPTMASEIYWFLPGAKHLVFDKFDSLSKIADINSPVLIIHGTQDDQIPIAHGKALATKAHEPKRFLEVKGAGHVNIPDTTILNAMNDFFK